MQPIAETSNLHYYDIREKKFGVNTVDFKFPEYKASTHVGGDLYLAGGRINGKQVS